MLGDHWKKDRLYALAVWGNIGVLLMGIAFASHESTRFVGICMIFGVALWAGWVMRGQKEEDE